MKKAMICGLAVMSMVAVSGCTSSMSGATYSRDQVRVAQEVMFGTVMSVADIQIEGTKSHVGSIGGAVLGGFVGRTMGGGSGQDVATAAGALVGAGVGSAAEEGLTKSAGLEIMVKLDSGKVMTVVQKNDVLFAVGQRVEILRGPDGTMRVRPSAAAM